MKGSKGPADLKLPTGGYQRVTKVKTNSAHLKVTVDLNSPQRATEEELADPEYRK